MSKFIYDLNSEMSASIDTTKGSVTFVKTCECEDESKSEDISEDTKTKIINYYKKVFDNNRKITIHLDGVGFSDEYETVESEIKRTIEGSMNQDKKKLLDVHIGNNSDIDVLMHLLNKDAFGKVVKKGSVYCSPSSLKIDKKILSIRKCGFNHVSFVVAAKDCSSQDYIEHTLNLIEGVTRCGIYSRIIINVSEEDLPSLKKIYTHLFSKGALRTIIHEILINCVYSDYGYENTPLDLFLVSNIKCYEQLLNLLIQYPELMAMRIVGDKFVNRLQSVIDFRIPLKPIQAYLIGDQIQLSIKNNKCESVIFSGNTQKCLNCKKFALCGGLYDNHSDRCIDFREIMISAYSIYNFVEGGRI